MQLLGLHGSVITAGVAVGGGVVGSWLTFKHNREVEKDKRSAEKQEEEFNAIREIVNFELNGTSGIPKSLLTKQADPIQYRSLYGTLKDFHRRYTKLSIEKRVKVFDASSLVNIEAVYQAFGWYVDAFLRDYDKFSCLILYAK